MNNKFYLFIGGIFLFILLWNISPSSNSYDDISESEKQELSESLSDEDISSTGQPNAYEMMHTVFVGNPEISVIKPLIEKILKMYSLPNTEEYRLKISSAVLSLRKSSAIGVTEMDILKHTYQNGDVTISLPDQLGYSSFFLEKNK